MHDDLPRSASMVLKLFHISTVLPTFQQNARTGKERNNRSSEHRRRRRNHFRARQLFKNFPLTVDPSRPAPPCNATPPSLGHAAPSQAIFGFVGMGSKSEIEWGQIKRESGRGERGHVYPAIDRFRHPKGEGRWSWSSTCNPSPLLSLSPLLQIEGCGSPEITTTSDAAATATTPRFFDQKGK